MKKETMSVLLAAAVGLFVLVNGSWPKTLAGDFPRQDKALSDATRAVLERGEKFILLSIDPRTWPQQTITNAEYFHKYKVLGQTEIRDPKRRSELLNALYKGVEQYETGEWASPECFIPRHGIKATAGTNWVELVICFECKQIVEDSNKGHASTMVGAEPRELFNRTLREAGVPLAKQ
jgi:hypothetical protein